ncbi:helix-turn-helix domain-containing protein [Streptomyces sp. NBC_00443]|uniref:helix-turn-helix domain-containing protein n=1 Tax=Streptomyces sp. NBC_00443 TaxID=2975743 RepID=UPI002E21A3AF
MRSRSPGERGAKPHRYRLNADALREKARAAGDTEQREIARRTGIDEGALSRLLAGTRSPSLETVVALAAAYGGPIEDLLTRPDGTPLRIPAQAVRTAAAVG